ncbi:hypothetical protein OH77DRAFT_1360955, partial [Trametes cingulata]
DESESEVLPTHLAIDPNTEDEGEVGTNARPTRKIFVAHAPAWRLQHTNNLLDELDSYIEAERREKEKATKGSTHVPRRRGPSRADNATALPSLRGATVNRMLIPRQMVNAAWLATEKGQEHD